MSQNTNVFGGKNPNSLYTPLSEDEQEVLERLALAGQYKVEIVDWGWVAKPQVRFGDARLQLTWQMLFDRPEVPMPVPFFECKLWTHSGILLTSKKMATAGESGQPLSVMAGLAFEMVWDIQIQQISPEVVRAIKPGAKGLTSRLGNMRLTSEARQQLAFLRKQEAAIRSADAAALAKPLKSR